MIERHSFDVFGKFCPSFTAKYAASTTEYALFVLLLGWFCVSWFGRWRSNIELLNLPPFYGNLSYQFRLCKTVFVSQFAIFALPDPQTGWLK